MQTQKDLPLQFLTTSEPVDARFVIGSFGSSKAYDRTAFKLSIDRDPDEPLPSTEAVRHGKLPEIHHVFKPDPKNPPVVVSLTFAAMVIAAFPILAGLVCQYILSMVYRRLLTIFSGSTSVPTSTTFPLR